MSDVLALEQARTERDVGMQRAANRAEKISPGWLDQAFMYLQFFATTHESFISEDVSAASKENCAFEQPITDRAWGSVYKRAVKENVIVQDGYGRSARRHNSVCVRWRSLIYIRSL